MMARGLRDDAEVMERLMAMAVVLLTLVRRLTKLLLENLYI